MGSKLYKLILAVVAVILLGGGFLIEKRLARDRDDLGLTHFTDLKGAPPVLALTTVALGGFRGLISNLLWIRANELQDEDKYFEMVQLADWITKLEPHFTQVWLVQAWNMAYNISVKFTEPLDRWRWVQRGIELLRDDGLRYNPDDVLIYRELGWFYQHKMGAYMDDAHMTYKQMWANEMSKIFGMEPPKWDELINPTTPEQKKKATLLREHYKMDPVFMKQVDEEYGPLEWRLPEAHAIYWGAKGLSMAKKNEKKFGQTDLFITLRRIIYQSMQLAFHRGRLIADTADRKFELGPNLAIIPHVNAAYEQAMDEDEKNRDHIQTAHRNFLKDAVFFLYTYNREAEASKWYKYLAEKYPDKSVIDGTMTDLPGKTSLETYAISRIQEEIHDRGVDNTKMLLEGLERNALISLAMDDDDHYLGLDRIAQKVWAGYQEKIKPIGEDNTRLVIPPLQVIRTNMVSYLLNKELSPQLGAVLRSKLGLPAATNSPAATNLPPVSTNSIPTNAPTPTEPASKP